MAVAVMEAELLRSLLEEGGSADLARRFFTAPAGLLAEPWALAVAFDLRFPEVEGERGPQDDEINGYLDQFRAAAAIDPALGTAFLRVANMMALITSLFSPELVGRAEPAAPVGQEGITVGEAVLSRCFIPECRLRQAMSRAPQGLESVRPTPYAQCTLPPQPSSGSRGPRTSAVPAAGAGSRNPRLPAGPLRAQGRIEST
ncbi:hypothetical protein [Streptomyces sp. NPDC051001]|uniref:hypothetical protein n=1 Tax=Streptomyces sp. NPDC051001 TaxID=3155795 RepID=UPI00341373FC